MGDLTGSSILNMLGTMGSAINKPFDAASGFVIGPHEGVPWGEQAARLAAGVLLPQQLPEFQRDWRHQDAAQSAAWADPQVQALLAEPGGIDAIRQAIPGFRPPPARDISDVHASSATNTVAVPSKPGDPTTQAYQLPLTPQQLMDDKLARAESAGRNPTYKRTASIDERGHLKITAEERDQDLHSAEEILSDPFLSQQYKSRAMTPQYVGVGPDHQKLFVMTPNKATEQGEGAYQSKLADIAARTGKPYDPNAGPGTGTDALDLQKKEQQDLGALRLRDPNAVVEGEGGRTLSPTYPGTDAAKAATQRRTNAIKLAQKQAADITNQVTKATSDEEFIKGVLKPIQALIPQLPDKEYRGVEGALTSAGRKLQRSAGTFFETDTLALQADVLANTIVTNVGRRFGEKGVFTDQDAARFLKGLNIAASSQESGQLKLDSLNTLMHEISERARAVAMGRQFTPPDGARVLSGDEFISQVQAGLGSTPTGAPASAPTGAPTPGDGMTDTERRLRARLSGASGR